jgi:hydroxymethylbilane synthase
MKKVRIGTRGSQLALWQAHFTRDILLQHGYEVELNIISTKGDRTQEWNLSFDKIEGKGFFTKEIEEALLMNEADLAVHSCKDMPTENAPGLEIAAYSYRANPSDVLLVRKDVAGYASHLPVKMNAVVGTSSARRKAQLLALRPDLDVRDLRGNVPTRIEKLRSGQYDAIILAAAGIERLNLSTDDLLVFPLQAPMFIPAPAQGVLAYQIRQDDVNMRTVCNILHDAISSAPVQLERDILHAFKGGCQVPLGVFAKTEGENTHLWISKATGWNQPVKRMYQRLEGTKWPQAEEIVSRFNDSVSTSVFISRDEGETDLFTRWMNGAGFEVRAKSFIQISPLPFLQPQQIDWLFFTSKNGVVHYFQQVGKPDDTVRIGAINQGTAAFIREMGMRVDFVGSHADTSITAQEFANVASGTVVLPQAKNARGIMEQYLNNAISLQVYDNQPLSDIGERMEKVLVFTSPINANAYLSKYALKEDQQIVSIGPSTTKAITAYGLECVEAYDPMPWSLADAVMSLC